MKYSDKTIMILGAGQLQVPLLQKAKEKGLKTVVVSPGSNDPGFEYADVIVPIDVKDEEKILEAAIANKIDGIITDQTDLPVRTAAYVSGKMGLSGIPYEIGCLFTDKYLMREKCDELGIPTPRYKLVMNTEEAVEFYNSVGGTMIMKPIDSQASHGVSKITSAEQLADCFTEAASYSRNGKVLLEEWIEGTEYPVDSYTANGKCNLLAIGQYNPFSIEGTFASYETDYPANIDEKTRELIETTNKRIVEGFGLPQGRTHGEYIVSNNKCYLVEIGARGGGSFFSSDDVRYVSGFCTEDYLIDLCLGVYDGGFPLSDERHQCCCTLFFYLPELGEVKDVTGLDKVMNLDYVRRNNLDQIFVGKKTVPVIDKGARFFLVVTAESFEERAERVAYIQKTLQIQTQLENGKIEYPIWK